MEWFVVNSYVGSMWWWRRRSGAYTYTHAYAYANRICDNNYPAGI